MLNPPSAESRPGPILVPVDFDPFAEKPATISVPLSEAQREIWAATQMGPEASCAYNLCVALRLDGRISVDALRTALRQLLDRHDALRMTFDASGDFQVIRPPAPLDVPLEDLAAWPEPEREARLAAIFQEEAETPFDLVSGPVVRWRIVAEGPDRHLLILTAHHIVCDGWSIWVLFKELPLLYDAARGGGDAGLAPVMQFSRFLQLQAEAEGRARAEAALAYWRAQFADAVPTLELPLDRARPAIKTYSGARETVSLDATLSASVRRVSVQHETTTVGFLLAAFQALLYRLSGQSDIVVGLPVSVRPAVEGTDLTGHATNLLPIRLKVDGRKPFDVHLRAVRTALLDAQDHQALTFGTLVRELNRPRDPSRTPLVAATFNFGGVAGTRRFPDAESKMLSLPRSHVNFELEMSASDTGNEFIVECSYNADLFSRSTVQRWLGHYATLLAGVVASPETAVDRLPLLSPAQREEQIAWNATRGEHSRASVDELVSAQAKRTPGQVAVAFEGRSLSYRDLEEQAERLARRLRARGVRPGVRVGVFMERCPEMVVGVLGVLKAGGAYVPLDPAFPADRLSHMVEDSGAVALLTHGAVAADLPSRTVPAVYVEDEDEAPAADIEWPWARPDDLAYVIYTSGSTGRPKGVGVTHRALVNFLESMGRQPGLSERDVLLSVTTLSFDIAGLELYLPLITGARLVLLGRDDVLDGQRLIDALASARATVMQATPATWRLLLESGWTGTPGLKVLCGGEALPRDLAEDLLRRAGEVWNLYGPTETTVWSSAFRVESGDGPVSIGHPIANTQLWVLDAHLEPQPVGVPGELYIGGTGVARGYWQRPELTAERFVPDPFSADPGARMYRTGDLARWLAGGTVECMGRLDHQVKVRGFRIELGEIEAALREHESVTDAAVALHVGPAADSRLVGFIVPTAGATVAPAELRKHLRSRLPEYMVPSAFVPLDALPLTPNGKVDRRRLPPPRDEQAPPAEASLELRTASERLLADVWRRHLGVSTVGPHDNFFDLGGHSLLSLRMILDVEKQTGRRLSPRTILLHSLEQISQELDSAPLEARPVAPTGLRGLVDSLKRGLTGRGSD